MKKMQKKINRFKRSIASAALIAALGGLAHAADVPANHNPTLVYDGPATNGPAKPSPWAYSGKQGIGTSFEAYVDHKFAKNSRTGEVSKVWFSLADGVVTETMYGLIHEAQIRKLSFVIVGDGYVATEEADTISHVDYIDKDKAGRPLSPAFRLTNTDKEGRFVIIKDVFTDPDHQTLMMRVTIKALKGAVVPYVILDPSMANTSGNDQGEASHRVLTAHEGNVALALKSNTGFVKSTVGFTGVNDGISDIMAGHGIIAEKSDTNGIIGNITLAGQMPSVTKSATYDFVLGFGATTKAAEAQANATLKTGYATTLARFNGTGKSVGWEDYLTSLSELKSLIPETEDNGKLLFASALMLKVQEDHTFAGAMIASLSNPWGDTVYTDLSSTGYKAVWPRDFYQVSMALLALGDKETPVASFRYLPTVQVGSQTRDNKGIGGWFQQKSHVDGTPEWVGVQLDQTAMPILLGQRLFDMGLITKADLTSSYQTSLKPAADFLSHGGEVNLGWNHNVITPPYSQQERWEEQEGHSPSTTAAVIAGLMAASDIATLVGDTDGASLYAAKAKDYSDHLEPRLYTSTGKVEGRVNNYYLRISRSDNANAPGVQDERNGHKGISSDLMIDQGFIELVRYGVRPADDARIVQSLKVIDNQSIEENLRVRYDIKYPDSDTPIPGFRRYGNDGYGDRTTGGNYAVNGQMAADQRGRVWPIFTGERGHYELALAARKAGGVNDADITTIRKTYVKGMELMANEGLMIPEQVFEGVGSPEPHHYTLGEGTDSATPLAWSHAEYIKLLRSLRDRKVWDENTTTAKAFVK